MCIKRFYYLWLCSDSAKTQDLEEEQPSVDAELRKLLGTPGWYHTEKVKHRLFADAAWSNMFICAVILYGVTVSLDNEALCRPL